MKVQIVITGQVGSNNVLLKELNNGTSKNGMFNGKILEFDTMGEAKKAIKEAYINLCNEEPDFKNVMGGIRKTQDNTTLYYDASKAIILKND